MKKSSFIKTTKNRRITFLIMIIALAAVVSGCQKEIENNELGIKNGGNQEQNQEQENQNQEEAIPKEEIKYLENGEIDTSDWKTYRNELYKMEIKYPPFLAMHIDSGNKEFIMMSYLNEETQTRVDKNWHISFVQIFPYFQKLSLEEKKKRFKNKDQRNDSFEEIEIENGYIFYEHGLSIEGYLPGAHVFNKNNYLGATIYIYSKNLNFAEYDPKYIKIFKTMLKTIKFDE